MEVVPTTRRAYCEWDTEVAREKNLESEEDEEELWELFDEEGMSDPFVTGVVEEFGRTAHYNRWKQARKARGDTESLLAAEGRMHWAEEDDLCEACCCREDGEEACCCCCLPTPSSTAKGGVLCGGPSAPGRTSASCSQFLFSRPGRCLALLSSMLLLYLLYLATLSFTADVQVLMDDPTAMRTGVNVTRAREILSSLCAAYERHQVSGDACQRLCYKKDWQIADYYESNKVVVLIRDGGQTSVYKTLHPFIHDYEKPDPHWAQLHFIKQVLDRTNTETFLGWPPDLSHHLLGALWPSYLRGSGGQPLSHADRNSLWALMQQPEYIMYRILPLSRVTPKIIGNCGHIYQTENLVAFRMKGYYMNLKGKILVHLMGTLKLFYEFLNEPLQWCDVRFENLGLSADYPKRFVMMDGDMLYTESRLKALLAAKSCSSDSDCSIGDCSSRCQENLRCSPRTNENLDVFCEKLINKLFGANWSRSNKYLMACHDTKANFTQKLNDLRLTWSWTLSDV